MRLVHLLVVPVPRSQRFLEVLLVIRLVELVPSHTADRDPNLSRPLQRIGKFFAERQRGDADRGADVELQRDVATAFAFVSRRRRSNKRLRVGKLFDVDSQTIVDVPVLFIERLSPTAAGAGVVRRTEVERMRGLYIRDAAVSQRWHPPLALRIITARRTDGQHRQGQHDEGVAHPHIVPLERPGCTMRHADDDDEPAMTRLKGRVALITGAQQGIGRAIALAFAHEGADVVVNYLDDLHAAERVAADARKTGVRALVVQGDVSRVDHGQALVARSVQELGGLDILVNNAGVYPRSPFLDLSEREWDFVLDVNLKGSCFCAQAAARAMIAGGRRGAIINLSSSSVRGQPRGVHYTASKGGVITMTRTMALELAPHGIRVNAIAPGTTDTAQPRGGNTEEELLAMAKTIPLGRIAQPEDIASVAVFLAGDESRHITGQTLHVNGGLLMR